MIQKGFVLQNCTCDSYQLLQYSSKGQKDNQSYVQIISDNAWLYSYLDTSQIQAAQALASFSTKLGRLPPNRKVTDGISRFLAAIRAVALDRMAADWTKG